jgi:hypothetical protein
MSSKVLTPPFQLNFVHLEMVILFLGPKAESIFGLNHPGLFLKSFCDDNKINESTL